MQARLLPLVLITALLFAGVLSQQRKSALASSAGKIVPTSNMLAARADHTATLLPDGRVLITGGMVENGVFLDSMEVYDPRTGQFAAAGHMSSKRVGHSATLLPNGKVLIVGGLAGRSYEGGRWQGLMSQSSDVFDPVTGKVASLDKSLTPRNGHGAILLPNGKVLILGGSDGKNFLSSVEIYDPATEKFSPAGNLKAPRVGAVAVLLKNGTVLITGGASGSDSTSIVLQNAEIYDPKAATSTLVGEMTARRYKHAATLLEDGRVLITGGSDDRDWHGVYDTAEMFDPVKRAFTPVSKMSSKRFKLPHATVLLRDGNALIAGGNRSPEIFNRTSQTFQSVQGTMGDPKFFATATLLKDGRVLIAGGYGNGTADRGPVSSNAAWVYQP